MAFSRCSLQLYFSLYLGAFLLAVSEISPFLSPLLLVLLPPMPLLGQPSLPVLLPLFLPDPRVAQNPFFALFLSICHYVFGYEFFPPMSQAPFAFPLSLLEQYFSESPASCRTKTVAHLRPHFSQLVSYFWMPLDPCLINVLIESLFSLRLLSLSHHAKEVPPR